MLGITVPLEGIVSMITAAQHTVLYGGKVIRNQYPLQMCENVNMKNDALRAVSSTVEDDGK